MHSYIYIYIYICAFIPVCLFWQGLAKCRSLVTFANCGELYLELHKLCKETCEVWKLYPELHKLLGSCRCSSCPGPPSGRVCSELGLETWIDSGTVSYPIVHLLAARLHLANLLDNHVAAGTQDLASETSLTRESNTVTFWLSREPRALSLLIHVTVQPEAAEPAKGVTCFSYAASPATGATGARNLDESCIWPWNIFLVTVHDCR